MADEPRGFNPDWVDPREPGRDPVPVGNQEPTPTQGVPPDSLPPPIKGGVGVSVLYDGYAYVIEIETGDLYATPKPGSVTWDTLAEDVEAMIRDFSWNSLTDVPAQFPPEPHTHPVSEIPDFPTTWAWTAITGKPTTYPPSAHTHTKDQITDFPTTWAWGALTGVPTTFPPSTHTHPWSQITDPPATYPPSAHSHPIDEVDGLQGELDLKLEDAPVDGFTYGRKNGAWEKAAGAAQIADTAPATGDVGTFWFSSLTGQLSIRYNDDGGQVWVGLNGSLSTAVMISDTPPTSAYHGLLWWSSMSGELMIRYNDGDTEQWVSAFGGGAKPFKGARMVRTATLSLVTNTLTVLTFDTETFDTDGFHDTAANTSRITIPAGVSFVELNGWVQWAPNATGHRYLDITKNAASLVTSVRQVAISGDFVEQPINTGPIAVVPGDYFELRGYQTSGGNLNVNANAVFAIKVLG